MKFLAWDTSSPTGAIALGDNRGAVECISQNTESSHSEGLLTGIHHLLSKHSLKLSDIDVFGVGVGPGSFTGLRIGVTTARTIAHALKKPLIPVSSLAVRARPLVKSLPAAEPFWIYENAFGGEVYVLHGPAGVVAKSVGHPFPKGVREETFTDSAFLKTFGETAKARSFDSVDGESLFQLVLEAFKAKRSEKPLDVTPRYLRGSSAEVKLQISRSK